MKWIYDRRILGCLPLPYRRFAALARFVYGLRGKRFHARYTADYLVRRKDALPEKIRSGQYPECVPVDFPNFRMFVDLCDRRAMFALDEAIGTNWEMRMLPDYLRPGDTFLDIGANHGSYSFAAARLVGASGRILAFEPQPHLACLIRRSAELNGLTNIDVKEIALSDTQGTAEFFVPVMFSGMGGLHRAFSGATEHRTLCVTKECLDDVAVREALAGTVFMKMDVEGNELHVLRGGAEFLKAHKPAVLFELNSASLAAADTSAAALLTAFQQLGYAQFSDSRRYPQRLSVHQIEEGKQGHINLVAYPGSSRMES
jgi:FkbM family methyltransferase